MGEQREGGFCRNCKKDVVVFRRTTNHLLHLVLAVLTAGLWIIVWMLISLLPSHRTCGQCGSSNIGRRSKTSSPSGLDGFLKRSADKERAKRRAANAARKAAGTDGK
ncbi:hypothetical protein ABW43_07435 [Stenotrophomonas maltophilia]|nr:hypothetical protein ABW43_07435 [Stenotrophomonas maltophilia]